MLLSKKNQSHHGFLGQKCKNLLFEKNVSTVQLLSNKSADDFILF